MDRRSFVTIAALQSCLVGTVPTKADVVALATVAGTLCDLDGSPLANDVGVRVTVTDIDGRALKKLGRPAVFYREFQVNYDDGAAFIVFQRTTRGPDEPATGVQALSFPLAGGTSHVLSPRVPR